MTLPVRDEIANYLRQFEEIRLANGLTFEQRVERAKELANRVVDELGDRADDLVHHIGCTYPVVLLTVATAISSRNATGLTLGNGSESGELMLVPIDVLNSPDQLVPREIGVCSWAPPLPDGRTVPALVDFLLTWEEVVNARCCTRLRELLAQVREGLPSRTAASQMTTKFGSNASSYFDAFDRAGPLVRNLRFAPAFYLPSDSPWFPEDSQRGEWSDRATQNYKKLRASGLILFPLSPNGYQAALYDGWNLVASAIVSDLIKKAETRVEPDTELSSSPLVLIEPFGSQRSNVATRVRVSVVSRSDWRHLESRILPIAISRDQVGWGYPCGRLVELVELHSNLSSQIAPQVQELDLLSLNQSRRLHVVVGPSFQAPDGLPIDSVGTTDPQLKRWWNFERQAAATEGDLLSTLVSSAFDLDPDDVRPQHSFALRDGRWYPVWIVPMAGCRTKSGGDLTWPLRAEALQEIQMLLGYMSGRAWTSWQQLGIFTADE